MDFTYEQVAKTIDHSLLNPTLTTANLDGGCELALHYNIASVCILPYYVQRCADILRGSTVVPGTTIGFPHGAQTTAAKLFEAERALADGAVELDMVVNISKVLSGDFAYVASEVSQIADLAHGAEAKLKVIFENCYLNDEQKIVLCRLCTYAEADWVKTSTGFGPSGATINDLELMLRHVGPKVQVKAAGGIRDIDTLLKIKKLGVTRCGATRTQAMLDEYRVRLGLQRLSAAAGHRGI